MLPQASACKADSAETLAGEIELRPAASLTSIPLRRSRRRLAALESLLGEPFVEEESQDQEAKPDREAEETPVASTALASPDGGSPAQPEQAPPPGAARPPSPDGDVLAFWKTLRGDRRFPSWTELDLDRFAEIWPHSLLLRFPRSADSGPPRLEASFTHAMREAAARLPGSNPRIDYTPQLTEWVIALSSEVARCGRPLKDEQTLPSWRGRVRYRAVALPFSDDHVDIDHVLCHVKLA